MKIGYLYLSFSFFFFFETLRKMRHFWCLKKKYPAPCKCNRFSFSSAFLSRMANPVTMLAFYACVKRRTYTSELRRFSLKHYFLAPSLRVRTPLLQIKREIHLKEITPLLISQKKKKYNKRNAGYNTSMRQLFVFTLHLSHYRANPIVGVYEIRNDNYCRYTACREKRR